VAQVDTRPSDEQYFAERAKALEEELDRGFPEAWRPETAGDKIIGTLVAVDVGHTAKYGQKKIAVLEDVVTKERKAVWLMHTALVSQFQRAAPAIGEMVAVRYDGKQTSQDGQNEYDAYVVRVDRPKDTTVDWSTPGEPLPVTAGRRSTDPPVVPTGTGSFHDEEDDKDSGIPF
jgi:hypothetical protein